MIKNYRNKVYDSDSLILLNSFYNNLVSRGYIFKLLYLELQYPNGTKEFLKLEDNVNKEFFDFSMEFVRTNKLKGNVVILIRNIKLNVGNISNEFITWNADFDIEIKNDFSFTFKEAKKQDRLRQEGINTHVEKYKFLVTDYLNIYIDGIRRLIRQRELTSVDFSIGRYVDAFYVVDSSGADNTYVFP